MQPIRGEIGAHDTMTEQPECSTGGMRDEPEPPSRALDVLLRLKGRRITRIASYRWTRREASYYAGRLGGSSCAIEVDTGEIVRFGLLDSLGCVSVFLERDELGEWRDVPPGDDDEITVLGASDALQGDPMVAAFEGRTIERIEILRLDRSAAVPSRDAAERGILFTTSARGELLIGVGLDAEDAMADYPAILLPGDVPDLIWARVTRQAV
jgi:hypothetical protein